MKIPKSKKDILAKTYLEYIEYIKTEPTDEKEILKNTVKIFFEIDEDKFNSFEYTVILDMYKIISNILSLPQELITMFKHNDIEYGINPNFDDMTFGEMVDCDTEDILQQICILYRPITNKKGNNYTIEKYKGDIEVYEELKNTLTLDIYLGFVGFFLKISQSLLKNSLSYTLNQVATPAEKKKLLEEYGVGLDGYMNYAMVI